MKKTNKNKTIPHGIILRRFVKMNFYFIQEILITIQTIRDMEEKRSTRNIPLFWLGKRLKVTFFSNCHSSREPHLKSLNSISVASFEEDLFESGLAFRGNKPEAYQLHYVIDLY